MSAATPRRVAALVAGLATVLAAPLAAQARRATSPEAAARAFARAVEAGRWGDAADMLDHRVVDAWRREHLTMARRPQPEWTLAPEQLMRMDSTLTREVAQAQVARMKRDHAKALATPWVLRELEDVPTLDSLERLTVREVALRWLRATDPRRVTREAVDMARRSGCPLDSAALAGLHAEIRPDSQDVIGAVVRGDTAYVVVREVSRLVPPTAIVDSAASEREAVGMISAQPDPHSVRVVRFRREGEHWLLVSLHEWFRGHGNRSTMVSCEPVDPPKRDP